MYLIITSKLVTSLQFRWYCRKCLNSLVDSATFLRSWWMNVVSATCRVKPQKTQWKRSDACFVCVYEFCGLEFYVLWPQAICVWFSYKQNVTMKVTKCVKWFPYTAIYIFSHFSITQCWFQTRVIIKLIPKLNGTGTTYHSGAPIFNPGFNGLCCSFVFFVVFCEQLFLFFLFFSSFCRQLDCPS